MAGGLGEIGGLAKPATSFAASDPSRLPPVTKRSAALIFVLTRAGEAAMIDRNKIPSVDDMDVSADLDVSLVLAFQSGEAADAVLSRARKKLGEAAANAGGWFQGVSAGQAAEAIKAEADALCHNFAVVYPRAREA